MPTRLLHRHASRSNLMLLSSSDPKPRTELFDREEEQKKLVALTGQKPFSFHVLLGPRSSGKSKLLNALFGDMQNAFTIDCRGMNATRPETFLEALLKNLLARAQPTVIEQVMRMGISFLSGVKISAGNKSEITYDPAAAIKAGTGTIDPASLSSVFEALTWVDWSVDIRPALSSISLPSGYS